MEDFCRGGGSSSRKQEEEEREKKQQRGKWKTPTSSRTPTHVEVGASFTIDKLKNFLSSSSLLLTSDNDASSRNL